MSVIPKLFPSNNTMKICIIFFSKLLEKFLLFFCKGFHFLFLERGG